jgi:hypothetical protein
MLEPRFTRVPHLPPQSKPAPAVHGKDLPEQPLAESPSCGDRIVVKKAALQDSGTPIRFARDGGGTMNVFIPNHVFVICDDAGLHAVSNRVEPRLGHVVRSMSFDFNGKPDAMAVERAPVTAPPP